MPHRCPHCHKEFERRPYWVPLAEKALVFLFLAFILWQFSSHFDETEIWSLIVFATGGGVYMSAKRAAPHVLEFVKRGMAT